MKIGDSIISFFGLGLCAGAWMLNSKMPKDTINHVGTDFFPSSVILLLTVAFLVNFVQIIRSKNGDKSQLAAGGTWRVSCLIILCLLYPIGFKGIGFILSTGIFTFIMLYLTNMRNIGTAILGAAATPVIVHSLFCRFFDIELPLGVLQMLLH
ncbi:tripartite tricarboxylate transporter TctB family protein [Propionispira raffinosivorans]|uniref:tripartite tricarboxylate transporter TctB family protein n=1 Tax=Propionispira raffinosivorans TaxID=86959 RepID=UPI00036138AD|nr:tripartite tricarboxylate transporter TctB family protein [Propionispira raffinosivorans]